MGHRLLKLLPKLYVRAASWLAGLALLLSVGLSLTLQAQEKFIAPGRNLEVSGVPPLSESLERAVQPYLNIYGLPLAGWHPTRRELRLKGLSSVAWVSGLSGPGAEPETTSTYLQESGIYDLYWQPQDQYLAYVKDTDGNEVFQLYLYDIDRRQSVLLTDGKTRNTEPVWAPAGDQIAYSSSPAGGQGVSLRLLNPFKPATDRLLAQSAGGYLKAYDWSPDGRQVVYCDFAANTASTLWLADVKTGAKTSLSPATAAPELYETPQFSRDDKGLYVITDHDSDVRRLAYLDLPTKQFNYLTANIKWDVEEFQLSPDGRILAFVINEAGISRLQLLDPANGKSRPVPQLPPGLISDLKWHNNSVDLAFNVKTPQTPNDVYALNTTTNTVEIWARSTTNGFDTKTLVTPQLVSWQAADKRTISGFLYRPPAKFKEPRPVIIDLHGGPEEQYRPGFGYEDNYFLNELGVAKIYPNVRGSSELLFEFASPVPKPGRVS